MPINFTPAQLRAMSDVELSEHISGWKPGTGEWHLANIEFGRRQNHGNAVRGWIAIAISVVALAVSAVSLIKSMTA